MKKILIGKINSVFGIRGEVKIISYCQHPTDIEKYSLFDKNDREFKLKISNKNKTAIGSSSNGGVVLIAKISGIDDRNEAEKLRGLELFANRDEFRKISDDEFYQVDLIGLDVIDEDGSSVGKVINVMDFGAGTMLEIEFNKVDSNKNLEKIENFPFKNEFFPEVNIKEGVIKIKLPEIIKIK
jgi:16S rRNA processing protein RimM